MKKKTLLIKTADLCIRIHYKYPYIEQQCETWRVNEGYEPDIEVSVTDEEIETKIKPLAEAGNKSKCRFVFALHPYMYNAIRYNSEENYQADLKVLQSKFEQVIKACVSQISILADDA